MFRRSVITALANTASFFMGFWDGGLANPCWPLDGGIGNQRSWIAARSLARYLSMCTSRRSTCGGLAKPRLSFDNQQSWISARALALPPASGSQNKILTTSCSELFICMLRRQLCCCSSLSRSGKLGSDAWWNDLPNAIILECWFYMYVKYWPYTVCLIFTSAPNGKSWYIRPSGGSARKFSFKNMAKFSQDEIALEKPTSKEYRQGKLWTRQTLYPGITAQLYSEGYGRPTTLAAMKYTNLL